MASLPGRKEIRIQVSDAMGELTSGTIRLDIRPAGTTAPKTNADHYVTRVGEQVTATPLLNDSSSGKEQLRLTRVDEAAGAVITPNFAEGTFTFQAQVPGTYYMQYLVSAGPNAVPGLVRLEALLAKSPVNRAGTAAARRCSPTSACTNPNRLRIPIPPWLSLWNRVRD